MSEVTVHYWGSIRQAAGVERDVVTAATLGEALSAAKALHPERRFADIVSACGVLVGDVPVTSRDPDEVALTAGAVVELLPPFAGG